MRRRLTNVCGTRLENIAFHHLDVVRDRMIDRRLGLPHSQRHKKQQRI